MAISVKHAFQSAKADGPDSTLVQPSSWNAEHTITAAAGKVLGRDTSGAGAIQELPIAVDVSGNVALAGALTVDGNTTLGNASTDTVTVNAASVSFANATTVAGALTFSGAIAFNGNTTLGDASTDTVTLNAATVSIPNNVNFSGGNVGIGTSSPASLLHVDGGITTVGRYSAQGAVLLRSAAGTQSAPTQITAGSSLMGNVVGQGYDGSAYRTTAEMRFYSDATVSNTSSPGFLTLHTTPSGSTSTVERMRIDSAGNVGIGTSSPQQRLHVSQLGGNAFAGIRAQNSNSGTGIAGIEFSSDATYAKAAIGLVRADANGVGSIVFFNSSSTGSANWSSTDERMRIDNLGQVGIGTNAPGSTLHISGDGDTAVRITKVGQADYSWQTLTGGTLRLYSFTAAAEVFSFASNGAIFSAPTYNNTATGSTVVVTSTGAIRRTSSSIKYKKDVETLDPALATNAIEGLRPVWYRTKNAEGDDKATWSHIGLIAEEVDLVEPRLVRYRTAEVIDEQKPVLDEAGEPVLDDEGNPTFTTEQVVRELAVPEPEDVDYARLSVLLLAEVKALRERVAALEAA